MDDSTRNRKRARLTLTPSAGDVDVDRISGLDDDVLLHVLELLGDARDAVRTGVLSRRWLGLWKRVPALSFASRSLWEFSDAQEWAALMRYASSINNVLVLRSQSGCAIERLEISYTTHSPFAEGPFADDPRYHDDHMPPSVDAFGNGVSLGGSLAMREPDGERYLERLMPASVEAIQGWICYAFQHGVKSFCVNMRLPYFWTYFVYGADAMMKMNEYEPVVFLDAQLPASASATASPVVRLEAMRLALGGARLRPPTTAMEFTSLADLSLEWIMMEAGSVHLLSCLLSSTSCPRLRKLRMKKICLDAFNEELLLETDTLSELRIQDVKFLSLRLKTPSLKVFHLYQPWHQPLTVSAPRLEELHVSFPRGSPLGWLNVDGDLPCVRSLKICMMSHRPRIRSDGEAEAEIDTNVQLLKHCSYLTCLDVTLTGPAPFKSAFKEWDDVDIIKSRVPKLPHITSLSVNISEWLGPHGYGASVANLLTRFDNLRHLSLHLPFESLDHKTTRGLDLLCDHQYHWKYRKFSLAHLQELELTGLTGTDCELWFIKAVLARAKRLQNVSIRFNPNCWQHESNMDVLECILLDEGTWTSHRDAFTLTCVKCGLV